MLRKTSPPHSSSHESQGNPPYLLLNPLHTIPLPLQILLPQTDLIIPSTHRQHIPTQTPAHPPQYGVEVQNRGFPIVGTGRVRGPYSDGLVLGGGGDVGFLKDGGRPGDVADPISVAEEGDGGGVFLVGGADNWEVRCRNVKLIKI